MSKLSLFSSHTEFIGKLPCSPSILSKDLNIPYSEINLSLQEMKNNGTLDSFELSLLGRKEFIYYMKN